MSENQVPESLHQRKVALKALDETKRIGEQIKNQYNRLKSCREHRTDQQANVKDLQAVQHFELLYNQQLDNLEKVERNFEILKQQYEESKNRINSKKLYVEDKLAKAKERVESQRAAKGKEELNLEKQILDLVEKWETAQHATGDFFPPWYQREVEEVRESLENKKSNVTVEMSDPNKPKIRRGIKKVEERTEEQIAESLKPTSQPAPPPEPEAPKETTPPPPLPSPPVLKEKEPEPLAAQLTTKDIQKMSHEELFAVMRPKDKNPFANVVTNTKAQRKQ